MGTVLSQPFGKGLNTGLSVLFTWISRTLPPSAHLGHLGKDSVSMD
jgi:hypothetical protein